MSGPILELREASKSFGQTHALSRFDLTIHPGTIHAIVGENGAGKSTLIKVMTGIHRLSSGTMRVDGRETSFASTRDAQRAGIAAIYQEPMIFPDLDVAENIFISHADRPSVIDWQAMQREAAEIVSRLGVSLETDQLAAGLTLAEQQTVEIARAISLDVRVLIMDEPSASLSDHEVQRLFTIARALRDRGVAVIYISHRLEEIFALADTVTVVRDGQHIETVPIGEMTHERLIANMVGRELQDRFARQPSKNTGQELLRVEGLAREDVFEDISFSVARGEVVCFSGLVGARRTDVALALFGIAPATRGRILIEGQEREIRSPEDAMALDIAYVSEDRRKLGIAMDKSVVHNMTLATLDGYAGRFGLIDRRAELADAERWRSALNIKTEYLHTEVGKLSGGNQQKVMLAKWLNARPAILIVDEPTRGIDVQAKAEVHDMLRRLAGDGVAIIIISSDLPEVLSIADRVLVMREGALVGEMAGDEATEEAVMRIAVSDASDRSAA